MMDEACNHCGSINVENGKYMCCGSKEEQKNWDSEVFKFSKQALKKHGVFERVKNRK